MAQKRELKNLSDPSEPENPSFFSEYKVLLGAVILAEGLAVLKFISAPESLRNPGYALGLMTLGLIGGFIGGVGVEFIAHILDIELEFIGIALRNRHTRKSKTTDSKLR